MKKKAQRKPTSGKTSQKLPEAELEVLACLWNTGALTAAEIREQLSSYRPMAHASVLSLLKRLSEKNLVKREKSGQGKAFAYCASRSSKPTRRRILSKLRQRIFAGDSVAMVASLLESQPTSLKELQELKSLLKRLERQHKTGDK